MVDAAAVAATAADSAGLIAVGAGIAVGLAGIGAGMGEQAIGAALILLFVFK